MLSSASGSGLSSGSGGRRPRTYRDPTPTKLKYYARDGEMQTILNTAKHHYRLSLLTMNAFPRAAQQQTEANQAYRMSGGDPRDREPHACECPSDPRPVQPPTNSHRNSKGAKDAPGECPPVLPSVRTHGPPQITNEGPTYRGVVKNYAREIVVAGYGLHLTVPDTDATPSNEVQAQHVRERVATLVRNYAWLTVSPAFLPCNGAHPVFPPAPSQDRTGPYRHPALVRLVHKALFTGHSPAAREPSLFDPVPLEVFALCGTAVGPPFPSLPILIPSLTAPQRPPRVPGWVPTDGQVRGVEVPGEVRADPPEPQAAVQVPTLRGRFPGVPGAGLHPGTVSEPSARSDSAHLFPDKRTRPTRYSRGTTIARTLGRMSPRRTGLTSSKMRR